MTYHWDEFSKSLATESLPRRETLRRLGLAITATVLGPLGSEYARAGKHPKPPKPPKPQDPCKAFCQCRNKKQLEQCLKACNMCGKVTSRLGGSCGNYFCCGAGQASCGSYCADLAFDPDNCGSCGYVCDEPGPYEDGVCLDGRCVYACVEGADYCYGSCTFLNSDPNNCGVCGNVCGGEAPFCYEGACVDCSPGSALCGDSCVDLSHDPDNCGACGNTCGGSTPYCSGGSCTDCGGYGAALCDGVCINVLSDSANCGACGVQCAADEICTFGACTGTCSGC